MSGWHEKLKKMPAFLPYSRQTIEDDDIAAVVRVLRSNWLTSGPEVEAFEQELAEYCGVRYAVACANGTAALHLAAMALELRPGDTVITTPVTFLATANCACFVGADVLFADVEPDTANIDPQSVEKLLAKHKTRVRSIIPVHFGGHPVRMEALSKIALQYGVKIIEDGCHALGAAYTDEDGRLAKVGSCLHSEMTVFSFHAVKAITTGEGGAVTTNDKHLYERLRLLRNHGIVRNEAATDNFINQNGARDGEYPAPWYYEMQALGFNYRITDIQCALGRSQLRKLGVFIEKKTALADRYRQKIAASPFLSRRVHPLAVRKGILHGYHLFVVRINFADTGVSRAALIKRLRARRIGTQVHYIPLHLQPYYQEYTGIVKGTLANAEAYYLQCLSLPLFPGMKESDVDRVVAAIEEILTMCVEQNDRQVYQA